MKGKIFNAQEVQAIISGNKTQFREVIKKQPQPNGGKGYHPVFPYKTPSQRWNWVLDTGMGTGDPFHAPYQVGQKIFCKEKFKVRNEGIYYGDFTDFTDFTKEYLKVSPWSLPQHMKQEHSRLTLLIKEIRVERLQSISCADYFAETGRRPSITHADLDCGTPDPRSDFKDYWNATHKKLEEKFEASPWVWKIEFEVVK